MKKLFGILNLLICFELIVGPNFPGLRIFSMDGARAQTCPAGLVFDSTLNRCITSDQSATIINATASCNGDQECYKRLAEEELRKGEEEGKVAETVKNKSGLVNTAAKVGAIAGPLTVVLGALTNKKCMNASGMAMIAGGVAFTAGNLLADRKHKKCLKKIREDWEKKKAATTEKTASGVTKVSMSQDQSEAFEMLAKTEECMQSSAKMKAGFYAAATLAYGASAVIATIEAFKPGGGGSCTDKETNKDSENDPNKTSPETRDSVARGEQELEQSMNQNTEAVTNNAEAAASAAGEQGAAEAGAASQNAVDTPIEIDSGTSEGNGSSIFWHPSHILDQIHHNIQTSEDLASLLANSQELSNNRPSSASIDDYYAFKKAFEGMEVEKDRTVLDLFKLAFDGMKNEFTIIATANAEATDTAAKAADKASGGALKNILGKLNSAPGRAIISGILTGLTAIMWQHANKQARVAKNRAAFLRSIKKEFNEAAGAISCTAEERNLPGNANCYCYTESGQRNSARANSQVCQQLFAAGGPTSPGDYSSLDFSNQLVCVNSSGQADESCACKQTRTCMNAIPGMAGNLGMGAISVASNGMKPTNDLLNGNIGAGSINGAAALQGAARLLDKKNQLEKQSKVNPANQKKMAKQIESAIMAAGAGAPNPLASTSSSLPLNMSASDAARALERELNDPRSFERIDGSPALAQPGSKSVDDNGGFTFDMNDPAAPTDSDKLAEVMGQDMDYGANDMSGSESNLFQILSNRYQRSGMRRLFDDSGKTSPEPSSKTDISK